ncbi:MAG: SDR family oxidoreductase, partial [Bdellovibrionota bacterium]
MAQNQTVLITGSSAGIGRETALFFHQQGWNVSATMRSPEKSTIPKDARLITPRLDVTDVKSIESAWKETEEKFGRIDAVVNNAGFGLTGPFEAANPEQIRRQFETNVFGLMTVCRTAIRAWREKNQQGNLVNVASMGGRLTVPYYSVYHSSKWAVEGFTEGLHYELAPIGIRVKLIEPGAIKTEFYDRSADNTDASAPAQYQGA